MIKYISTRGPGAPVGFRDVLLSGMAPDGGLYIPDSWPSLGGPALRRLAGKPYTDVAAEVLGPFIGGDIAPDVLRGILTETYGPETFSHAAITPLVQIAPGAWLMELFHGPTIAFKDVALQLLGRLFDHVLQESGERVTIVGATSGDTGSAAIEACKGCKNIDIFILHPRGRVSEVQRRQMTTVDAPNVHNIALEGTFDDCQAMVKAMFADEKFRKDMRLSAVNSINWARIVAQSVYYFAAALALGAPDRPASFAVPTGNFGNVYAAWVARRMGLPIHRLIIGTNRNDILTRFFETGKMKRGAVEPTISPSMDIQVSSNFERYLCDLMNRDHKAVGELMKGFGASGAFGVDPQSADRARNDFVARRCSEQDTLDTMRACHSETGILIDPHTAVGLHAAMQAHDDPSVPLVVLACAHPAKFPDAVEKATGIRPELPERLREMMQKPEFVTPIPHDLAKVQAFVRGKVAK